MKENSAAPAENEKNTGVLTPTGKPPAFWKIIVISLVVIIFTAGWLYFYEYLNQVVWGNNFVAKNKWIIPVGAVFFSFIVGLALKYLRSPSVVEGGFVESLKGEKGGLVDYRSFPGTLVSSFLPFSLELA